MSTTAIAITGQDGSALGTVGSIPELAEVVALNPGATWKIAVTTDNPCALHPAFEAAYCPSCGTATRMAG